MGNYFPPAPSVSSFGPLAIDNQSGNPGDVLTKIDDNNALFAPGGGGGGSIPPEFCTAGFDGVDWSLIDCTASPSAFTGTVDSTFGIVLADPDSWFYLVTLWDPATSLFSGCKTDDGAGSFFARGIAANLPVLTFSPYVYVSHEGGAITAGSVLYITALSRV